MHIRDNHYTADEWRWQYPHWAYELVQGSPIEQEYDLCQAVNPFLLHGDFDGDGRTDVAVRVRDRQADDWCSGVVVVHRSGTVHYFSAAGLWEVYRKGEVYQGVVESAPPDLSGDALLFFKPEATSSLHYWNGSEYVEYHQGD